ncbi:phage tail tape measure protein [Methylobacterium nodulans]|uniref:Bacteriophage tail tape measure N-terminal domain-containing protein n=1 Tax=Methylobacterium nodulans (strain LMG 21967 / CNCM I-2342 / ORS 2060) TaxID=460265 RepID=B8ILT0_METNO|nr:hypothetical protein [Methylobacterium nodulans]ACL62055.1 hypothetical protein Mnod_7316 [Methylobacterium nodulans ORS 2060]
MNAPLTIRFASDISGAKAGMQDLAAAVVSNMTKVSAATLASMQNMDRLGLAFQRLSGSVGAIPRIANDLAAGVAAYVVFKLALDGLTAAAKAASDALESTAKIGDDAARLGVSTTFLQTYQAQARALKVDVDDLTQSLETAKAAFTVKLGEGGVDARNQSSFEARLRQHMAVGNVTQGQIDSVANAIGTEQKFRAALDVMIQMQATGRELAALDLASRLFPPGIVDRIRSGEIELDRFKKSMDDVRNPDLVLLKPEEIARAQELQRRLEDAQATLDRVGKEFYQDLVRAGARLKEDAIIWKETIAAGAQILLTATRGAQRAAAEYQQGGAGLSAGPRKPSLGAELGAIAPPPKAVSTGRSFGPTDQAYENAVTKLRGNLGNKTLLDQAARASDAMASGIRQKRDTSNPLVSAKPHKAGGADGVDPLEAFIGQIEKSAAAIKAEVAAYSKSNAEKQIAINLAKAEEQAKQKGVTLTDEQIRRIKEASAATAQYKDKLSDLEQVERQAAETARTFGDALANGLADAVLEGRSLGDVLMNLEKQLARSALQALFTGQGPLAGLLGTAPAASAGSNAVGGLFGEITNLFRANGGSVEAGRAYTVGELGRELFVPNQDGRVIPIARGAGPPAAPDGASRARPIQVSMVVQTPDAPSFARSEAQITAALYRAVQRGMRSG